ncbi:partner and localizer of BRCA2 [Nematolebias whitei]|uniref:partner and localizer of BRCA2 n=1 Tax=Nematolebias whitei TaxID=451745 RepID=UPI00189A390A|nr:partner and localizer of BRCA2 [Nematolebias whitei]
MDINVGDVQHSEEQLKNTLHCDDKEKLRRKLAQLQREYLKTAQRLQKAERLEAVRRHVRNRISQQNHQEHRELEVTPNSSLSMKNTNNAMVQGTPQCQGHTEGPAASDKSIRNQVIRFRLPPDAAGPQTPDSGSDSAGGHRPSSALRLRSRRSRLRLERRSAEAGSSTHSNQQGQEQKGRMESVKTVVQELGTVESNRGEEVNGSEELFSATEFPSLLVTHCNTQEHTETGDKLGKEDQRDQQQQEKEADLTTEERGGNVTHHEKRKVKTDEDSAASKEMEEKRACEGDGIENSEKNLTETVKSKTTCEDMMEIKEEKKEITNEGKAASLLESCTIIEGLLFPAEYYVRTTRRMTILQSRPDMQAVALSQLSMGQHRRSRGRGRASNRSSHTRDISDQHTQTVFSSLTTPSTLVDVWAADASVECSQSSGDISNPITTTHSDSKTSFSAPVTMTRPLRGRRRRGRGRGRPRTSGDSQHRNTSVSSSQSVHEADGTNACLNREEADPESGGTHSSSSQPSSQVNEAAQHVERVHPKRKITFSPHCVPAGTSPWQSLLLRSSSTSETSHLPPPFLFPALLVNNLKSLDLHQDFHLPDDQFASLKLHKLRQVAVASGVERFSTPSRNTRSSIRSVGDPTVFLPFSLNLTPTATDGLCAGDEDQLQDSSTQRALADESISEDSTQVGSESINPEANVEQQLRAETQDCEVCVRTEHETGTPNTQSQSCTSIRSTHGPINCDKLNARQSSVDRSLFTGRSDELEPPTAEKQTEFRERTSSSQAQLSRSTQAENRAITEAPSFDRSQTETQEKPAKISISLQPCNQTEAVESPARNKNAPCPFADPSEPSTNLSKDTLVERKSTRGPYCSQLALKSPPASVNFSFMPSHPSSPAPASSPVLPSLGITPHFPLTSSPAAPSFSLPPPPHSPSTQAPSPPYPSLACLPPSLPPLSTCSHIQESSELPPGSDQGHTVQPAACPSPPSVQLHGSHEPEASTAEEPAERCAVRRTHTLKAAAGGSLVDACCLPGSSGGSFVAAAGKWAVCLWGQTSASDWSFKHTWTFREPVINVFPVPDTAGLVCVTLGQLEIREVRLLSCCSLTDMLICEGTMQVVVGLHKSRVVASSHTATGSTLQVFTLSDSSSSLSCQPLASPGVCVGALAPVDELSDALIGTDEGGHLFVWNLNSGQLLCRVLLGFGFSHTACLRGYSHSGVLMVLLQHQFLSSLDEEEAMIKDQTLSEVETKTALFSLVGINPLNGKSVLASRLYPPKAWSGRLCEADVYRSCVMGLNQSGRVCVWELGKQTSRMVEAPEGEDWQLARWGGEDTLVMGHHNGDVSLLRF